MLAKVTSATVIGIDAHPIDIEVEVGKGLPGTFIVGLPDAGVKEGRVRIQEALGNTGFHIKPQKIVINLAPADQRKDGAAFDVPIAVGILAASGELPADGVGPDDLFVGELALDGRLRPVRGVLPVTAWAARSHKRRLFVPAANAAEARVACGDCEVIGAESLADVVGVLRGQGRVSGEPVHETQVSTDETLPDLADIRGQPLARRALEIAAAGGHNVLFVGPPGSGKTMLANRLPGILPPLTFDEALATTMIYSVAGLLGRHGLVTTRPFRAPHHTVSMAGLVGGGPTVRPGEISLAHNGVLFLDELLEFPRTVLEALRQPLEDRHITIVRARRAARFPADFMLVAALNPCPCGHYGNPLRTCTCSGTAITSYRARLSGPLLDRMDMHVDVPAVPYRQLSGDERGEASIDVRARVLEARKRQMQRAAQPNARLGSRQLSETVALDPAGHRLLERAVERYALSARAIERIRRVARTIADLDRTDGVLARHVGEALQYRCLDREIE